MGNYAVLKASINDVIKTNGNKEITGQLLNQTLMAMVDSLGENYQFAGVAVPSTNPGTPDQNIFYLATQAGTYTNFGAVVLPLGIHSLMWNGTSWSHVTVFAVDDEPTSGSTNLVDSDGIYQFVLEHGFNDDIDIVDVTGSDYFKDRITFTMRKNIGTESEPEYETIASFTIPVATATKAGLMPAYVDGVFDVNRYVGSNTPYDSLSQVLNNAATLIPTAVRRGGMSIKFIQSSDNKYVQYRLMANDWSTTVTDWQGVDNEPIAGSDNLVKSGGVKDGIQKLYDSASAVITASTTTTVSNLSVLRTGIISQGSKFYVKVSLLSGDTRIVHICASSKNNKYDYDVVELIRPADFDKYVELEYTGSKDIGYLGFYIDDSNVYESGDVQVEFYIGDLKDITVLPNTINEVDEKVNDNINFVYKFSVSEGTNLNKVYFLPASNLNPDKKYYLGFKNLTGKINRLDAYYLTEGNTYAQPTPTNVSFEKQIIECTINGGVKAFGFYIFGDKIEQSGEIEIYITADKDSLAKKITELGFRVDSLEETSDTINSADNLVAVKNNPILPIKRNFSFMSMIKKWGYIGDSLAAGDFNCFEDGVASYEENPYYSWGQCLNRMFDIEGTVFATGGASTKAWIESQQGWGWDAAKLAPKHAYIIELGQNDSADSGSNILPVGDYTQDVDFTDYNNNGETFAGYYAGIIQRLKSISPRAKFFCVTLPHGQNTNPKTVQFNEQIRAMADIFSNVFIIDLYSDGPSFGMGQGDNEWSILYRLGFHLSPAGYQYMAFLHSQYIDAIIRENPSSFKDVGLLETNKDSKVSYTVSGSITVSGQPAAEVLISVVGDNGKFYTNSNSDGSYSCKFLEPGSYTIYVNVPNTQQVSRNITITASSVTENFAL